MNLKHVRNIFVLFIVTLVLYASYLMILNNLTMQNETVSKALIIGQNEKITNLKLGLSCLDTIDPILTHNKDYQYISKLIYDSLFTITEEYKMQNCLATECSKISDTAYIIKLRNEVYWTNGEKFSAQDVVYTIDKIKTEENIYQKLVEPIESIQIIDEYTLKINLYKEIIFFEYNLIFPIVKNNIENQEICSTGMYTIKENEKDSIILEKNENWWNKEKQNALLEKISIELYSNKLEEYKAFKKSEIDIINTNNIHYEEYIGRYGYSTEKYTCPTHTILAFNLENDYLSNENIRQAIACAIDKQNIIDKVFENKYIASEFMMDYGSFLYSGNLYENIYNPKHGNDILSKYVKNYEINLNLIINESEKEKIKIAELIKNDLENIGIVINLEHLNDEEYNKRLQSGKYDLYLCTIDLSLNPNLASLLGSKGLLGNNNTEIDKILYEIGDIQEEKILLQKYKELQKYYYESNPCISLYNEVNTLLYSKNLRAILTPNYFNLFYGIERWYLVQNASYVG